MSFDRITPALLSLELLQTYLLIHDDWMDGDDVRRGGPSVHAALASAFGSAEAGAVSGVLAGDLAAAYALEALVECDVAPPALVEATREMAEMQHRVVLGQTLDVRSVARDTEAVDRMFDLKTGSYTVRGPLRLGASLAGASEEARQALDAFARPAGIAFQLRDDVLGLFGDPAVTGKRCGSDLREQKFTSIIAELDSTWAARLEGAAHLEQRALERLVADIEKTGARDRVEARIRSLTGAAQSALASPSLALSPRGHELLSDATIVLTTREL